MVLGFIVVDFVDWDSGVDNGWLNSLLVDDWLNCLMCVLVKYIYAWVAATDLVDVVVNMLPSDDWRNGVAFLSSTCCSSVLELHTLLLKACLNGIGVTVVMLSVFNGNNIVGVLFWEDFAVLNRLHGSMIMVLVHLAVNGGLGFLVADLGDVFVHDSWSNLLVYCGVMVTSLVPEKVILSAKPNFNRG